MSNSLSVSPAPGRVSLDVVDKVSESSHGKFSFEDPTVTISFKERKVSTVTENGIMAGVDMIVVEETTFVN